MRILISSRYLFTCLSRFDFENDTIRLVKLDKNNLSFIGRDQWVGIVCEVLERGPDHSIQQSDRRWDEVINICGQVQDQPIILSINTNVVKLIFEL